MKVNLTEMAKRTPAVILPDEVQAIEHTLKLAERYGYGNLMSWLATGWTKRLSPLARFEPLPPFQATPYPANWLDVE